MVVVFRKMNLLPKMVFLSRELNLLPKMVVLSRELNLLPKMVVLLLQLLLLRLHRLFFRLVRMLLDVMLGVLIHTLQDEGAHFFAIKLAAAFAL